MDKAQLSEIRARLRQAAEGERRPPRPLLAPFRRRPTPESVPSTAKPTARRVGLNPTYLGEDEDLFVPPEVGRGPFGQRSELRTEPPAPLLLSAPASPPEAPRWPRLLATRVEAAVAETPYHPEDLSDTAEDDAERLYAAAGLVPVEPGKARPWIMQVREAPPPPSQPDPQRELLVHLERVFLAELAGLEARRL